MAYPFASLFIWRESSVNPLYFADAHCDFLYYMYHDGWSIAAPQGRQAVALPYMRKANVALQFFAAWVDGNAARNGLEQCICLIDTYWRMLQASDGALVPFSRDFLPGAGKIAALLTIEGGEAIAGSLEALRMLYKLGARAMTLTWNYSNELASPAMRRANLGLTRLGRKTVREMDRLGMALDVAHLSDAGINEALSIATRPIFASHSNARAICNHRRSLKDAHIKEIAKAGGIICVNFYPPQLCALPQNACAADVARHAAYIASLVGPEHVALGSDFDGMNDYPRDLKNQGCLPALAEALRSAGFTENELEDIAYNNLRNYIVQFV